MNCISLWQPWASAIAVGLKTIETRSWPAPRSAIRKPLAIAAAKRDTKEEREWWVENVRRRPEYLEVFERAGIRDWCNLPMGAVVCTTTLLCCLSTNLTPQGKMQVMPLPSDEDWGNFGPDRYAWGLVDIKPLSEPVPVVGRQGIFNWEAPQ